MPEHFIPGKDASLEASIARMQSKLAEIGFQVEERSWLHPVDGLWSVHIADRDCPLLFTNGKGASQLAAQASALGEFFERLSTNYFWSHYFLGEEFASHRYTHYPEERWFSFDPDHGGWPEELLTPDLHELYNPDNAIPAQALVDRNSGNIERGICALPFSRVSDDETIWVPVNIIGNLYVSNGMSAGNSKEEARAQALSEIVERYIKFRVIREGLCLPDVPETVLARFPQLAADIRDLRAAGFGILVKDGSLVRDPEGSGVVERRKMSFAGVVVCTLLMNGRGDILGEYGLNCFGLPETDNKGEDFEDVLAAAVDGCLVSIPKARRKDEDLVAEAVRRSIRAAANERWGKKPITEVTVLRVD